MRIGAAPPLYKMQSIVGSFFSIFVLCATAPEYFDVADPACLFDPEFCPSWIPDPKPATKEKGEKNCCPTYKYHENRNKNFNG
jgi:hypothetical protein